MVKKLNSSALLIALLLGILMSGLVAGVSVVINEHIKLAGQSREGRLAYRSALSGIEEGLLAVKYAKASGRLTELYNKTFSRDLRLGDTSVKPDDLLYEMKIETPFSSTFEDFASYDAIGEWPDSSTKEKLKKINMDDTLDLDLTQVINDKNLKYLDIFFSGPYTASDDPMQTNFTALNWVLVDLSKNATSGTERQLINSGTNNVDGRRFLRVSVSDIATCVKNHNECHLRIRPQIAFPSSRMSITHRLLGTTASSGKHSYIAIRAIDQSGRIIIGDSSEDNGIIAISSVGQAGQAVRKLIAKIDVSSGAYLGLFDFGIYCGTNCIGLGPDQQ
jgi:hypothetical protein